MGQRCHQSKVMKKTYASSNTYVEHMKKESDAFPMLNVRRIMKESESCPQNVTNVADKLQMSGSYSDFTGIVLQLP